METGRMSAPASVAEEMDFLHAARAELRREHSGRFLVIRGRAVVGAYRTEEEAFREGVRRLGMKAFLIAHFGEEEEQAWVPVLVEVGGKDPAPEEEFIPSHSWRRGKLLDDPIVELDLPLPQAEGSR
jgi:hypothetical protein